MGGLKKLHLMAQTDIQTGEPHTHGHETQYQIFVRAYSYDFTFKDDGKYKFRFFWESFPTPLLSELEKVVNGVSTALIIFVICEELE